MYEYHEAANAFPLMDKGRYKDLLEDIKQHGLIEPITLCEGKILDGRNRYKACLEAGIEPKFREYDGNPWNYVWSLNGQRRDLTADQRYLIWKFCHEHSEAFQEEKRRIQEEANRKRSEAAKEQPRTEDGTRLAEKGQVVPQKVGRPDHIPPSTKAKTEASKTNRGAVERGDKLAKERPDLAEQVRKGEVKMTEAYRQMKRDEISKRVQLPESKFRVIYADPPWEYGNTQPDYQTEQRDYYPVMKLSDICAIPVRDITEEDAVLFLWVTSPILEESFQVIKSWGFKYKASFIWDKIKHNIGHYNSVRHEFLLVCTKGSCQPDVRKLFDSVQSIERTEHSRKPEEFRKIIDTLYPLGKRIELFARGKVAEGWETYGNETCLS